MRLPTGLALILLPSLLVAALDGDEDIKHFLSIPENLESEDYENTVKQQDDESMPLEPIAPEDPKEAAARVSATKVMHEEEDYSDLLAAPADLPKETVKLLEEIDEQPATVTRKGGDKSLKAVTFAPFRPTFRIPITTTTVSSIIDPRAPAPGYGGFRPGALQQLQPLRPTTPAPRNFNYFQHYPFYRLPKAWRLRPDIVYTYPADKQDSYWEYNHRLATPRYNDYYNLLRHPNPYGCGLGAGYPSSGGCGGGGADGRSRGGYLDSRRPLGTLNEEGKGEWNEADDLNLATKEDPLEDIDLETLERIDKAGKSQDRKDGKGAVVETSTHPTLLEDDDLIDGHQFLPIGKDKETFTRVGEQSLVRIGSEDAAEPSEELSAPTKDAKKQEEEKISPEALEELKAFEQEFSNLPPRFSPDEEKTETATSR